jgi:predicted outer membrane repeat protein
VLDRCVKFGVIVFRSNFADLLGGAFRFPPLPEQREDAVIGQRRADDGSNCTWILSGNFE